MTPAEEARFIALWNEGLETAAIAARLGIKATTAQSRAHRLQQSGLIQPRPRGGNYPRQRQRERSAVEGGPSTVHHSTVDGPPSHRPPSTVAPETWELKQLKHSIRWTV